MSRSWVKIQSPGTKSWSPESKSRSSSLARPNLLPKGVCKHQTRIRGLALCQTSQSCSGLVWPIRRDAKTGTAHRSAAPTYSQASSFHVSRAPCAKEMNANMKLTLGVWSDGPPASPIQRAPSGCWAWTTPVGGRSSFSHWSSPGPVAIWMGQSKQTVWSQP